MIRSGPTSRGSSYWIGIPVFTPGPTTSRGTFAQRSARCSYSRIRRGTVHESAMPSSPVTSRKSERSAPSSSPVRCASVAMRQRSPSTSPSYKPKTVCVLPTSTASSIAAREYLEVFFARRRLADALGERFRRPRRLVALPAQLLDRHVAGDDDDLRARDHARGAVLVPDPDVLEPQVDERIRRLRRDGLLEAVAEIRRIRREHAVAEEGEDRLVLLLQPELELRLVFVQLVEVRHGRSV